jgi:hypothetical protein
MPQDPAAWRHLEQRVAQYFERHGYSSRINHRERGRSGLVHEIDVLAEKRDAAGVHRVVVECKAWRSPIEKDVIYKLEKVMQDAGLTKGIIVSVGGLRSGARIAAEQAHVEVWGPDEIRHNLGDEALAGLPLRAPDTANGVPVSIDQAVAEREIRKARGGFAGVGSEDIDAVDLVWIPCIEFHLAVTRVRPGLIKDKEELVRRWALFETLTGRLIGARDEGRAFETVDLDAPVVRQQRSAAQVLSEVRKVLGKHRSAKSDAAVKARQEAYNAVGLPGSAREFAVEAEKAVVVPFFIGTLSRKGTERLVAIHAGNGARVEAVERALHEKVDVLRRALNEHDGRLTPDSEPVANIDVEEAPSASSVEEARPCRCGAAMVLRHRKADGAAFWGCSTFPRCRHTEPV